MDDRDNLSFENDMAFISHLDTRDSVVAVFNCRDVVLRMCSFLDVQSLIQVSAVSTGLRFVTTNHLPLWRTSITLLLEQHPFLLTTWFVCDDSSLQLGPFPVSRRLCYDLLRSTRLIPRLHHNRLSPPPSLLLQTQALAYRTGVQGFMSKVGFRLAVAGGLLFGPLVGMAYGAYKPDDDAIFGVREASDFVWEFAPASPQSHESRGGALAKRSRFLGALRGYVGAIPYGMLGMANFAHSGRMHFIFPGPGSFPIHICHGSLNVVHLDGHDYGWPG